MSSVSGTPITNLHAFNLNNIMDKLNGSESTDHKPSSLKKGDSFHKIYKLTRSTQIQSICSIMHRLPTQLVDT